MGKIQKKKKKTSHVFLLLCYCMMLTAILSFNTNITLVGYFIKVRMISPPDLRCDLTCVMGEGGS